MIVSYVLVFPYLLILFLVVYVVTGSRNCPVKFNKHFATKAFLVTILVLFSFFFILYIFN